MIPCHFSIVKTDSFYEPHLFSNFRVFRCDDRVWWETVMVLISNWTFYHNDIYMIFTSTHKAGDMVSRERGLRLASNQIQTQVYLMKNIFKILFPNLS